MCETQPGRWNQPASAEHVEAAAAESTMLERRLCELEHGIVTPDELHERMLAMCAMCQEIVGDVESGRPNPQLYERLRFRIDRLRQVGAKDQAPIGTKSP